MKEQLIDVKIISEDYSLWELSNKIKIKARSTVSSLLVTQSEMSNDKFEFRVKQNSQVAIVGLPNKLKCKIPVSKNKLWKGINNFSKLEKKTMMDFKVTLIEKNYCYYEVEFNKNKYLLIIGIDNINPKFTKKYLQDGEPVYIVNSTTRFSILSLEDDEVVQVGQENIDSEEEISDSPIEFDGNL